MHSKFSDRSMDVQTVVCTVVDYNYNYSLQSIIYIIMNTVNFNLIKLSTIIYNHIEVMHNASSFHSKIEPTNLAIILV